MTEGGHGVRCFTWIDRALAWPIEWSEGGEDTREH